MQAQKLTKSICVSNFNPKQLDAVISMGGTVGARVRVRDRVRVRVRDRVRDRVRVRIRVRGSSTP